MSCFAESFIRHPPAIHPPFTRHPPMEQQQAAPTSNAAACRLYRKRKREGAAVSKRRSAVELTALEAKPLEQRTEEEKEAVRNHRKWLKRKERIAAAAAVPLSAVPAPTR